MSANTSGLYYLGAVKGSSLNTLLKLDKISKSFASVRALQGVSFDLWPGEVHALVGENGAGKSTLIKIISGAHQTDSGTLEIAGQTITANDPVFSRRLGIAVIYQRPALLPDLTVAENIALRMEPPGAWRPVRWKLRKHRARELLSRIGATIAPDAIVQTLSMPEQQLVEIARALGADARILILDEPTASLSDREVQRLLQVIRDLRTKGVGVIYISHRLDELHQVADRVTILRDGRSIATRPMAEVNHVELIRLMVGREMTAILPKQTVPLGDMLLGLRNLGCRRSGVHGVNLQIRAGEIVGLAGLIGAGRTELARTVFGLMPADEGESLWRGKPVAISTPARAIQLSIAYVPEDRRRHGIIPEMTVTANTTLAMLEQISSRGWMNFRRERLLANDYVRRLSIKTPSVDTPVSDLSGGNQQKVSISRWLATQPKLLILDEPTQGIDVGAKAEIHRLMVELAGRGMAILLISSELPEILGMCDRIAVMHAGTIAGTLDRAEATQENVMALALAHSEIAAAR
jgi:rhamnose transport system ATP-binding protein